jgi:hypothetical protein
MDRVYSRTVEGLGSSPLIDLAIRCTAAYALDQASRIKPDTSGTFENPMARDETWAT